MPCGSKEGEGEADQGRLPCGLFPPLGCATNKPPSGCDAVASEPAEQRPKRDLAQPRTQPESAAGKRLRAGAREAAGPRVSQAQGHMLSLVLEHLWESCLVPSFQSLKLFP